MFFNSFMYVFFFQIHIQTGQMVCNNCRRVYKIENGIPNMVLSEDEV